MADSEARSEERATEPDKGVSSHHKSKKRKKKPGRTSSSESLNGNAEMKKAYADLLARYNRLEEQFKNYVNAVNARIDNGDEASNTGEDRDEPMHNDADELSEDEMGDEEDAEVETADEEASATEEECRTNDKYAWITKKAKNGSNGKSKNTDAAAAAADAIATAAKMTTKEIKKNAAASVSDSSLNHLKASSTKTPLAAKPAPIYVREKSSTELIKCIIDVIGDGKFYTVSTNKAAPETKIQVSEENHFRALTKELERLGKMYYTFQLKSAKGLSVVIRGIDPEVDVDDIKSALESAGDFKVKNIHNIKNRLKVAQSLHTIELDPESAKPKKGEVHPIYNIRYLLHRKISVEEPRRRNGPVQCFNCQEYGHTKSYCHLPTVCVICGDNHPASKCNKDRTDPTAKLCKNCGGNHTANFRGCIVYEHMKKNSSPSALPKETQAKASARPQSPPSLHPAVSYASALRGISQPTRENSSPSSTNDQQQLIPMIMTFMSSMQQMLQAVKETQTMMAQVLMNKNA